jgi:hypothetical protein
MTEKAAAEQTAFLPIGQPVNEQNEQKIFKEIWLWQVLLQRWSLICERKQARA